MTFHAQASHTSLYRAVEEASHRFSLAPSDIIVAEEEEGNVENANEGKRNVNNNSNNKHTIYQLETIHSSSNHGSIKENNTPRSSSENSIHHNENSKEERRSRPWSPSFSLKPLRSKFAGRQSFPLTTNHSMDNNNNNDIYKQAKKKKSKSALGEFFSSFSTTKSDTTPTLDNNNNNKSNKVHYRLSSFPFEDESSLNTTTTPSSSITSLPPLLPPLSTFQNNNNSSSNNRHLSSTSIHPTAHHSAIVTDSSIHHQQKNVGQLLFGTNVNDPSFFKKEFHNSKDDLQQTTINSLEIKNSINNVKRQLNGTTTTTTTTTTASTNNNNNNNNNNSNNIDTFTLQQWIIDCLKIQQNIKQLNKNDESDNDEEHDNFILPDSDLTSIQHIIQQLEQFIVSSSTLSFNNNTSIHAYHHHHHHNTSAAGMQDQLELIKQHIQSQPQERIRQLKECIYQYIFLLNQNNMIIPNQNYWIEGDNDFNTSKYHRFSIDDHHHHQQQQPYNKVDHLNERALWFQQYFCGKPYITFLGHEHNYPIILNIVWDQQKEFYRCILRSTREMDRSLILSSSHAPYSNEWKSTIEDFFNIQLDSFHEISPDDMVRSGIENDLIRLDKEQIHHRFKFGVIYIKQGQTKEEEWFSNDHNSESFDQFLDCLGERIPLIGYQGWAAGLDTKSGDSGQFIYTSKWKENNEMAFHVSTLIPTNPNDKQHIPRKRHIGNDIVCIAFIDGHQPFDPTAIKSQFLHVFIIVRPLEYQGKICWRVEITSVKDVPHFGPKLPPNQLFYDKTSLQQFLSAKLINAEYAALKAPKFTQLLDRARQGIITNAVERGIKLQNQHHIRKQHTKSLSSDGFIFPFTTSLRPSSSTSLLKDISDGGGRIIVGLTRRRSTQGSLTNRPNRI
ncbi:hypothetical protein BJ944DRAFT_188203, partial [Cunninghamella echinulata]